MPLKFILFDFLMVSTMMRDASEAVAKKGLSPTDSNLGYLSSILATT